MITGFSGWLPDFLVGFPWTAPGNWMKKGRKLKTESISTIRFHGLSVWMITGFSGWLPDFLVGFPWTAPGNWMKKGPSFLPYFPVFSRVLQQHNLISDRCSCRIGGSLHEQEQNYWCTGVIVTPNQQIVQNTGWSGIFLSNLKRYKKKRKNRIFWRRADQNAWQKICLKTWTYDYYCT